MRVRIKLSIKIKGRMILPKVTTNKRRKKIKSMSITFGSAPPITQTIINRRGKRYSKVKDT